MNGKARREGEEEQGKIVWVYRQSILYTHSSIPLTQGTPHHPQQQSDEPSTFLGFATESGKVTSRWVNQGPGYM